MPILYKTSHRKSELHGTGIFAEEEIPEGAVWWTNDDKKKGITPIGAENLPNIIYTRAQIEKLLSEVSKQEAAHILNLSFYYEDADAMIFLRDGSGPTNHSFENNSEIVYDSNGDPRLMYSKALKLIKAGEQITENYETYISKKNNWVELLFRKYEPSRIEFEEKFLGK